MLTIRKACESDQQQIKALLDELDLYYHALAFKDFRIAEDNNQVVGTVQIEEFPNFLFLGSLGIKPDRQKQGLAKKLITTALKGTNKDTYLYTIIPDFFKKLGFEVCPSPSALPKKDLYECEYCHPTKCVCMVKKHAA